MANKPTFYLTTAIAYPNGKPHIGHAYEVIASDALARFKRLDGYDVFFLTGSDEHGIKMMQTAEAEGLSVRDLADRNVQRFKEMASALNCSHDRYIRTTEDQHKRASQAIWQRMVDAGDIYLDKYAGWYSVRDEAFYAESETEVRDGVRIGPQGSPVEWVEEESYFFRLSTYQDKLLNHYKANPDFIAPNNRRNEIIRFVEGGLRDLSISRTTFDWGIPVPGDEKHVMYVWVDALTNYMTGVGYPDTESETYQKYWPADIHVIGKDITRFHAIYWPAFLMSAKLELPKRVFAHGFLLNKGEKMSKSVGNVLDPFDLTNAFGVDQVRYFVLRDVPFGQDGSYSEEGIINRSNADLANDLGNLAQRSLSMVAKHCDAAVPQLGDLTEEDSLLVEAPIEALKVARKAHETQEIHLAMAAIWKIVSDANKYFAAQEPWALRKTNPERMHTVLYVTVETVRQVAILAQPYIPAGAEALLDLLAVDSDKRSFAHLGEVGALKSGAALPAPKGVFPRYQPPAEISF